MKIKMKRKKVEPVYLLSPRQFAELQFEGGCLSIKVCFSKIAADGKGNKMLGSIVDAQDVISNRKKEKGSQPCIFVVFSTQRKKIKCG